MSLAYRNRGSGTTVRRRLTAVATGIVCLLGASLTAAFPTAQAAANSPTAVLLCQGTETVSYSPPLTYTSKPTDVSGTEDLGYCPIGGVTKGSASGGFNGMLSCTSLRLLTVSSSTYSWNSGQTSVVTYTTTAIERLLDGSVLVTEQGTVTSGFDQGRVAAYQIILPQLNVAACLGAGVGQLVGPEVLTFS
jgi:hypothetical protein